MSENNGKSDVKPTFTAVVRELVKNRPAHLTIKSLAASCDRSTEWLSRFVNDDKDTSEPGANVMVLLYDLLSDRPLNY